MKKLILLLLLIGCMAIVQPTGVETRVVRTEPSQDGFVSDSCSLYIRVTKVIDGDTFEGITSDGFVIKFRIAGIDAPERGQFYGDVAKAHLQWLIYGKTVGLELCRRDIYGRLVVWVFLDGTDIGAEMLRQGLAWHYNQYDENTAYSSLEREAKRNGLGLWCDERAVEPWRWREMSKWERDAYR